MFVLVEDIDLVFLVSFLTYNHVGLNMAWVMKTYICTTMIGGVQGVFTGALKDC